MPASIRISSGYFKRETFEVWNPDTQTFGPARLIGRKKRIDAFVSLWHRSSRRAHIYVLPESQTSGVIALRHANTGVPYLVSESRDEDSWQRDGNTYEVMLRCHRVDGPSGGVAQHYPVTVAGTGDDLGPVTIGPPVLGFGDTELRSTGEAEGSVRVAAADYFVAYSRNLAVAEGDYIAVAGNDYLIMERHYDSGYAYSRAKQESPHFQTVEFKLPSSTPGYFDPHTGTMTAASEVSRQVSAFVASQARSGSLPEHTVADKLTLYIYLRHIGFEPLLGHGVIFDGVRFTVDSVRQSLEDKQWRLDLSR
jgi:hypothetical protein